MITGGAASQWPVGKVSDHLDRRWMIIAVALMSSAAGIALVMSYGGGLPILLALAALYGAFSLTIYSLCVAHVNDIADYERFVEVASGALLMYGIGATAGPLIASGLMEARDMAMLFAYAATLHLALAVLHLAPDAASAAARRRAADLLCHDAADCAHAAEPRPAGGRGSRGGRRRGAGRRGNGCRQTSSDSGQTVARTTRSFMIASIGGNAACAASETGRQSRVAGSPSK